MRYLNNIINFKFNFKGALNYESVVIFNTEGVLH